jgi:hypothetical protein
MKNHPFSRIVLLSQFLIIWLFASPAIADYAVSHIPEALLEDANSVYRENHMEVIFTGPGRFTVRRHIAVTILNENGKGPDVLTIQYDSNSSPRFTNGEIFDADGNSITRLRRRDLMDQSNVSDISLYEDNRIMGYIPRISSYPYTVSYEYEISYSRGMYYAMSFYPVPAFNRSTQKSSLRITYSDDMELFLREFNLDDVKAEISNVRNSKQMFWNFENINAIRWEHLSPVLSYFAPRIMFAPKKFEYDGYQGSNESWEDFGKWIWAMNQGRDNLPPERVAHLNALVANFDNDRDKVRAIYKFMQSRTRYVNISLGIGGLQPFDAETVDRTGYGDCKALTNYMMAMLKAVGIESFYTLVRSGVGRYNIVNDFTSNQFDHVILSVPLENDTIWLECTSQILPFNHLGDFTDNRPVLIVREDGGHLIRTPAYSRSQNINNSKTIIQLDLQGHGTGNLRMDYGGIYFVDYMPALRLSSDEQQRWLYRNFSFPNYTINNHSLAAVADDSPVAVIEMDISLRSYASTSGQRMFVPLNLVSASRSTPPRIRNRQHPFVLNFERSVSDTLIFRLPAGFEPETSLNEFSLESEFGSFQTEFIVKDNEIWYIRKLETYRGFFPAEKYQDFFRFHQSVTRADAQRIAFVRRQ